MGSRSSCSALAVAAAVSLVAAGCGGGARSASPPSCGSSGGKLLWSGSTVWFASGGRVVSSRGTSLALPAGAVAAGFRACDGPSILFRVGGELRAEPLGGGRALTLLAYRGTTIRPRGRAAVPVRGLPPKWEVTSVVASPSAAGAFVASAQSPEAGIELCGKGLGGVYRVSPAGTRTLLVDNPCKDDPQPAFSPDGSRISYVDSESNALYTVGASGADRERVATRGRLLGYAWSPDGRRIAVESRSHGVDSVWVSTLAGGTRRVAAGELAGWSSDGREVAVVRGRAVVAVPLSGGRPRALLHL